MAPPNRLLERMRISKTGWRRRDLDRLYAGFGFERTEGAKHILYEHHLYPDLRTTVTRSNDLPIGYIQTAISLIDEAKRRESHG